MKLGFLGFLVGKFSDESWRVLGEFDLFSEGFILVVDYSLFKDLFR